MVGIFPEFLETMVRSVCGNCSSYKDLTSYYDRTKSGKNPVKESEMQLKGNVNDDVHFYFPISGLKATTVFQSVYQFVQIVESPGSAFIVVDQSKKPKTKQMINSLFAVWPLMIMILLLMTLAGILIWLTVSNFSFKNKIYKIPRIYP